MNKELYTLRPSSCPNLHVGTAEDGRQILLGSVFDELVAYTFDTDGRLVSRERRQWWACTPRSIRRDGQWKLDRSKERIAEWKNELGVADGPIRIMKFFDPDLFVGIQSVPRCLEEAATNETEEERYERRIEHDLWGKSGRFVLWWMADYWLPRHEADPAHAAGGSVAAQ